jgi:hypothetical protein
MKKVLVLATAFAFALSFGSLAFAADAAPAPAAKPAAAAPAKPADKPADVTLEGKVAKEGDKLVITLDKDSAPLKKGDKVTILKGGKEGDTKVTGALDAAKKEITVKAEKKDKKAEKKEDKKDPK